MATSTTSTSQSQLLSLYNNVVIDDDDDDFQVPLTQTPRSSTTSISRTPTQTRRQPLKLKSSSNTSDSGTHQNSPPNKPILSSFTVSTCRPGKENAVPIYPNCEEPLEESCGLDFIESSLDHEEKKKKRFKGDVSVGSGYLCNSVESWLMRGTRFDFDTGGSGEEHTEELDVLLKLCAEEEEQKEDSNSDIDVNFRVECPLCGFDISDLSEEQRQMHTNGCLDKGEIHDQQSLAAQPEKAASVLNDDVSPVVKWLRSLGLAKYEEAFVREEIDWDTLHWLTEEDLIGIGVTTLGPRKKIVHALNELRKGRAQAVETHVDAHFGGMVGSRGSHGAEIHTEASTVSADVPSKVAANKLITDYFPCPVSDRKKVCSTSKGQRLLGKGQSDSVRKHVLAKSHARKGKVRDIPLWCQIPGTPFRVDAFKYLRGDCSHWFLTHFHMDHYQGLTKSFCHGKIYCSLITAKLVNMKIGISWDKIQILPLNQKINIAGTDVTCLDANHCPGSVMILFEPPNGKIVLHTGDFRFGEEMTTTAVLQVHQINTLILDTTYCNPQYDFPKQEAVIQFVLDAIQAEAFNPKTLFLIGSYTIGKERLFLEVARVLRRKVYVTAAKFHLLECLGFSEEDMQWFTLNEHESHIHVVPMWTLASFKRLKHVSDQYKGRFSLIVAFSPTGWTFGKGKKKSPGRRWQQGTIIRYEVPYSEHCSFTELKEFVKLVSPETIIPSVNNDGPDSANAMVSQLSS